MTDYVKSIMLRLEVDKSKMKEIEDRFDDLVIKQLISPEAAEDFKRQFVSFETQLEKIKKVKKAISEVSLLKGEDAEKTLKELQKELKKLESEKEESDKETAGAKDKNSLTNIMKEAFGPDGPIMEKVNEAWDDFKRAAKQFFKDILSDAMKIMKEMASFNLGSSLFINREAREQALRYGLTNAENFAFGQVSEEMGISSEEDLFWMNPTQQEYFAERMGYWSGKYNELNNADFFKQYERFTVEWKNFRTDLSMQVINFFMENKDTIMFIMKTTMDILSGILKVVGWIAQSLGQERSEYTKGRETQAIISGYRGQVMSDNSSVTNNLSKSNTNVKIDNTFNGVQNSDKSWLQNAGALTYEQVIKALQ